MSALLGDSSSWNPKSTLYPTLLLWEANVAPSGPSVVNLDMSIPPPNRKWSPARADDGMKIKARIRAIGIRINMDFPFERVERSQSFFYAREKTLQKI